LLLETTEDFLRRRLDAVMESGAEASMKESRVEAGLLGSRLVCLARGQADAHQIVLRVWLTRLCGGTVPRPLLGRA